MANMYCVRCRVKYTTEEVKQITSKNGKPMLEAYHNCGQRSLKFGKL